MNLHQLLLFSMPSFGLVGGAIAIFAIVFIALMMFISRNYIKVAPNQVAVFYGRKYKTKDKEGKLTEVGFKVVSGGSRLKIPIIESVQYLDLNVFSIALTISKAPNKDNVPVNLKAVANVKILSDEESLRNAVERFLGMKDEEIKDIAFKNLEGHLRSIAGTMTLEELVGDRAKLNSTVLTDAKTDLAKMGLGIDLLTIQEVSDDFGYILELGKKRIAEVTSNAKIGTAEAEMKGTIGATTSQKDAALTANTNLIAIAESEKNRDVQKQKYLAEVATETETAAQAGPKSKAIAQKAVYEAEQETKKALVTKETEVAEQEALRTESQLKSTVIKPAEADKQKQIIDAEAKKKVQITEAEANQESMKLTAQGVKDKDTLEGEGRGAAILAEKKGEADGEQAILLARAAGKKADLLAEAAGVEAKAEAFKKLDSAGKFLLILEQLQTLIPNSIKEFAGVMEAIASPLANVDKITITDFGGGNSANGGAVGNFANTVPAILTGLLSKLKASGIDLSALAAKFGINADDLMKMMNLNDGEKKPAADKGGNAGGEQSAASAEETAANNKGPEATNDETTHHA